MTDQTTPEALAQLFHETYERLAPEHGYRTREASAKPWADVPDTNKALMIATCAEVLNSVDSREQAAIAELDSINATVIQTGAAHGLSGLAAVRQLGTRYQEEKDRAERLSRAYNAIRAERNEARAEADSDPVVLDLRARLAEARARYDAEEVIVDGNVFRRGNLPTILADSMNSGAEHAREAKRLASQIDRLADWLTEHTDEPKDSYGAVEAAINAIEERDAQLNEASAAAWEQGYALGVNDERTAESNIGIAGFGMKVSPARENPYRAAERVETTTLADPEPHGLAAIRDRVKRDTILTEAEIDGASSGWIELMQARRDRAELLAALDTELDEQTHPATFRETGENLNVRADAQGNLSAAPLTLAQAAGHLHGWAGDLADGARTDWPAGHPDIIRGIRAAADWLDARDRYETETRDARAARLREAGRRLGESFQQLGEAIRDGAAKARAVREAREAEAAKRNAEYLCPNCNQWAPWTDGETTTDRGEDWFWCQTCAAETPLSAMTSRTAGAAEPTLRDIMAAAYRAGLGIRKFDEYELAAAPDEPATYHEWSITTMHGREIGRLTIIRTGAETAVQLDSRRSDYVHTLVDPTPADILAAAREAGLIGDTDA